jgi:hypothetical protein
LSEQQQQQPQRTEEQNTGDCLSINQRRPVSARSAHWLRLARTWRCGPGRDTVHLQPLLDTMSLGLFEKSAEGPQRWQVRGRSTSTRLVQAASGALSAAAMLLYYRRKKIRKLTVAVGVPAAWDGAHSDERLGRNDQWLAGRCPLFRPLLTILYAHQRSTSDYSTVSLARWTGCVRARCVAACLGSDESSCMLCCTSAHDACVR